VIFTNAAEDGLMADSAKRDQSGFGGAGKYLAVASELPCTIVALLFAGQIMGTSIWGVQGGIWGAIIGTVAGFMLGTYGVYATVGYFDRMERGIHLKGKYMPPPDEISEDVIFRLDEQEPDSSSS
jgi:hypothetical protein